MYINVLPPQQAPGAAQSANSMYTPGGGGSSAGGYPLPAASLIDAVPQQQPAYPYFQQGLPAAQVRHVSLRGAWPQASFFQGAEV